MLTAVEVASYFLGKDPERKIFNKTLVHKNGRDFYEGNARLNKYLHMAQNVYIAKTGRKLFEDDLYAYDNGAVVPVVQENYAILCVRPVEDDLPQDVREFLDKLYQLFESADLDEMIAMSHEDPEWEEKHAFYSKTRQRMDSLAHINDYREQYGDVLALMERLPV